MVKSRVPLPSDYNAVRRATKLVDLFYYSLEGLTDNERYAFCSRHAIFGGNKSTYREIGTKLKVTLERARQIYIKALRKINWRTKHPFVFGDDMVRYLRTIR